MKLILNKKDEITFDSLRDKSLFIVNYDSRSMHTANVCIKSNCKDENGAFILFRFTSSLSPELTTKSENDLGETVGTYTVFDDELIVKPAKDIILITSMNISIQSTKRTPYLCSKPFSDIECGELFIDVDNDCICMKLGYELKEETSGLPNALVISLTKGNQSKIKNNYTPLISEPMGKEFLSFENKSFINIDVEALI